jgi:iron(III) transport system substrate-binding protein
MTHLRRLLVLLAAFVVIAAACGDDNDGQAGSGDDAASDDQAAADDECTDTITVYSGRDEELIGPILDSFTAATGIEVEARYGDSAELALLIQTEGDSSPADVFISQSPGALGFLAGLETLDELPDEVLDRVAEGFRASDGTWVGLTGRVRVVVYNEELVEGTDLPDSVLDLTDPAYAGRVAVAPTNGSFQDFVTAMRNELGDEATLEWLEGMAANDAPNYPKNSAIVEAVGRGEVDMGLVNHYYNLRALEADPSVPSRNHFLPPDDLGALVIVTGGSVLAASDSQCESERLLTHMLTDASQGAFVAETQEYALAVTMVDAVPEGAPALDALAVDTIDYELLGDGLEGTVELIRQSGIEQ